MTAAVPCTDTIAILGLGRVGTALGFLLRQAGYRIAAVASRSPESLQRGVSFTGGRACISYPEAAALANCIFITTSDDAIADVCGLLAARGILQPGCKVIHMSGAGGLDLLESARRQGAHTGSIHPLQTLPDIETAIASIPGSVFAITATDAIAPWCTKIVTDLGGTPFYVSETDKPLYHAAACLASNYLVTLMHMVLEMYRAIGLDHADAWNALRPLVEATLKNIEKKGTLQALTGPIARGDTGTIDKHLQALGRKTPDFLPAYRSLGLLTANLGLQKKTLHREDAEMIKKLLEGGDEDGKA